MGFKRRKDFEGAIHHIIAKGNNGNMIYKEDYAKRVFLKKLEHYRQMHHVDLLAYCIMDNHIHLLVVSGEEHIAKFMQALQLSYSKWYQRYKGTFGQLYSRRYVNYICSGQGYIQNVIRYIHTNPVKAGLSQSHYYQWSSYKEFVDTQEYCNVKLVKNIFELTDKEFVVHFTRYHEFDFKAELHEASKRVSVTGSSEVYLKLLFKELKLDPEKYKGCRTPLYYAEMRMIIIDFVYWQKRVTRKAICDFFGISQSYSYQLICK